MAPTEKVGALFSTLTLVAPQSVAPSLSVAVAVQVMVSDGEAIVLLRATLEPVPIVVEPFVQL